VESTRERVQHNRSSHQNTRYRVLSHDESPNQPKMCASRAFTFSSRSHDLHHILTIEKSSIVGALGRGITLISWELMATIKIVDQEADLTNSDLKTTR
jgi:hypothetical protein